MAFNLIFAAEVYDDLQQAVDFYNARQKGLGARFVKTVKNRLFHIKKYPFHFQVRYDKVRCAPVELFPYTVHYIVIRETNTVQITAVFCDFRDPEIWDSRFHNSSIIP
jgi:hypothetical protein